MKIIDQYKNELEKLESPVLPAMTLNELTERKEKISYIKNPLSILEAITRVIEKRRKRGAREEDINSYKQHLINDVWKNSDIIRQHITELAQQDQQMKPTFSPHNRRQTNNAKKEWHTNKNRSNMDYREGNTKTCQRI